MKVMISAGDPSGDLYGAALAQSLLELEPDIGLMGIGGRAMAGAGVGVFFESTAYSAVGIAESLRSVRVLGRVLGETKSRLEEEKPDCVVFIDFPGFNLRLADIVQELGIPGVYFFPPAAWAWGRGRARKVARVVTKVASVFPFEAELYREAGANVTFVGHPLLDMIKPVGSKEGARRAIGIPPLGKVVGLLPGSRAQEIRLLLPVMVEAVKELTADCPDLRFVLPIAPGILRRNIEEGLGEYASCVTLLEGQGHLAMEASDVIIVASGTATLEACILGVPMVIVYKVSASTWALGKLLVKIPHIGLPNILAGREIVPELLQGRATGRNVRDAAWRLLRDPGAREEMCSELAKARGRLGEPGAIRRTAGLVLDVTAGGRGDAGYSDRFE